MAKPTDSKNITVRVSTIGIPTRRRAGLALTPTPKIYSVTAEQLAALKADTALSVVPITGGDTASAAELVELTAIADRYKAQAANLQRQLAAALDQLAEHGIQFTPPRDEPGADLEIDHGDAGDDFGAPASKDGGDTAARGSRRKPRDGAVRAEIG